MENKHGHIEQNRARIWQIGLFSLNNTSTNLFLAMMGYVSYYANGIAGLSVVLISVILTGMRIFDGVTDPVIGYFIDKTNGKYGKFRPYNCYRILTNGNQQSCTVLYYKPCSSYFKTIVFYNCIFSIYNRIHISDSSCKVWTIGNY